MLEDCALGSQCIVRDGDSVLYSSKRGKAFKYSSHEEYIYEEIDMFDWSSNAYIQTYHMLLIDMDSASSKYIQ